MRKLVIAGIVVFELVGVYVLFGMSGEQCRWSDCHETLKLVLIGALWAVPGLALVYDLASKSRR